MPANRRASTILIIGALAFLGACARSVAVESEPGPAYTLAVVNPMPHDMIVSYTDGTGTRLLGTVPANGREQFLVTGAATPSIRVLATDEEETHTVDRAVTLRAGGTTEVQLTM